MIKTEHSLILNRLHQMQEAFCYAAAKEELALAETTILQLERQRNEARDLLSIVWHCMNDDNPPDFPMSEIARHMTPESKVNRDED